MQFLVNCEADRSPKTEVTAQRIGWAKVISQKLKSPIVTARIADAVNRCQLHSFSRWLGGPSPISPCAHLHSLSGKMILDRHTHAHTHTGQAGDIFTQSTDCQKNGDDDDEITNRENNNWHLSPPARVYTQHPWAYTVHDIHGVRTNTNVYTEALKTQTRELYKRGTRMHGRKTRVPIRSVKCLFFAEAGLR